MYYFITSYVSKPSDYLASINCIEQWSSDNHLILNALKCKPMLISCKKQPLQPTHPLMLNCENLEKVNTYKYLGILLISDMSWSRHISILNLHKSQTNSYRRFYGNADQDTIKQLYISLVRPHLEYGSQVWDPHLARDKTSLENVQKFACRIASAKWDESYEDLLHVFNLASLQERRLHAN